MNKGCTLYIYFFFIKRNKKISIKKDRKKNMSKVSSPGQYQSRTIQYIASQEFKYPPKGVRKKYTVKISI